MDANRQTGQSDGLYVAVIGDIRASRQRDDRAALQREFQAALNQASDRFRREDGKTRLFAPTSGPTITTGDEFQALFDTPTGVEPFVLDVTEAMHPIKLRFGIGLGSLDTELKEEAIGMDGPCFHEARDALNLSKEQDAWVRVQGFGRRFDPSLNGVLDLIEAVREDWTDRQREFAFAYRELGVQQAVAERFGMAKSTVSESLAGARAREVRAAEKSVANLMAEAAKMTERG